MVRIPPRNGVDNKKIGEDIIGMLQASENSVTLKSSEYISAQVGEELTEQGGLAMIFALIMIMIYIVFRFQWKFSIGAVLALIHDVMITLGIFSFFQLTFDLSVLAAILAVVGYSLNDTIVIFDRIRENFRSMRTADFGYSQFSNYTNHQKNHYYKFNNVTCALIALCFRWFVFGGFLNCSDCGCFDWNLLFNLRCIDIYFLSGYINH